MNCPSCGAGVGDLVWRAMKPASKQRVERFLRLKASRDAGETLRTIGSDEGISHERVRQILNKRYLFDCPVCGTSGHVYNGKVYANANPAPADTFIGPGQVQPGAPMFTVYLLKRAGEVVYIGQSKNVAKRRARAGVLANPNILNQVKVYDQVEEWRSYSTRSEAMAEEHRLQHAYAQKYGRWPEYNRGCAFQCRGFVAALV